MSRRRSRRLGGIPHIPVGRPQALLRLCGTSYIHVGRPQALLRLCGTSYIHVGRMMRIAVEWGDG